MSKAALKLVEKTATPIPFDDEKGKRRMAALRAQLISAAVRYVQEGKEGTRRDRIRSASNLAGIPIALIEIEAAR